MEDQAVVGGGPPAARVLRLPVAEISRTKLRRLVAHWDGLRPAQGLPRREDLRPEDLSFMLSQIILVDAVMGPGANPMPADCSFLFRMVGSRIEATGHRGLQGRWAHELTPLPYRRLVLRAYSEAVREAAPNFYRINLEIGGRWLRYERVTLPLAGEDVAVGGLLVGTDWDAENDEFFRAHPALGG